MQKTEERNLERGRYPRENGFIIVDVAVKNSRQLFNERDPAPFRERDLDEEFVRYILNSVREFPLKAKMKIRVFINEETNQQVEQTTLQDAFHAYFNYESKLSRTKLRERLRVGRWFFLVGLGTLFTCLSISQFIESAQTSTRISTIAQEGFVIIGWVAMWRPIEMFLYDWWPHREQRLYLEKLTNIQVDVVCGGAEVQK
jgi:hypothetical protein